MAYRIKRLREERGMTQEELSSRARVSRAIISRLENGKDVVTTTETLKKIASALGCRVEEIFFDEKSNKLDESAS